VVSKIPKVKRIFGGDQEEVAGGKEPDGTSLVVFVEGKPLLAGDGEVFRGWGGGGGGKCYPAGNWERAFLLAGHSPKGPFGRMSAAVT